MPKTLNKHFFLLSANVTGICPLTQCNVSNINFYVFDVLIYYSMVSGIIHVNYWLHTTNIIKKTAVL